MAAAAIAAACLLCATYLTAPSEGMNGGRAYYDPAHIATQCFGDTEHVDWTKVYSATVCTDLLRTRLKRDYAPHLLACVPGLADKPRPFAALLDASYNAGWRAVCKSRMAAAFNAGQWQAGCNGFRGWYVTAVNRQTGKRVQLAGLVKRREAERALCLKSA